MKFFPFLLKTAPQLLFAHAVLMAALVAAVVYGNAVVVVLVYSIWAAALVATVHGTMKHRQRLIEERLCWWITAVAHNGELGHLPHLNEAQARKWIEDVKKDPLKQWKTPFA
jgi:hypothetical protein